MTGMSGWFVFRRVLSHISDASDLPHWSDPISASLFPPSASQLFKAPWFGLVLLCPHPCCWEDVALKGLLGSSLQQTSRVLTLEHRSFIRGPPNVNIFARYPVYALPPPASCLFSILLCLTLGPRNYIPGLPKTTAVWWAGTRRMLVSGRQRLGYHPRTKFSPYSARVCSSVCNSPHFSFCCEGFVPLLDFSLACISLHCPFRAGDIMASYRCWLLGDSSSLICSFTDCK